MCSTPGIIPLVRPVSLFRKFQRCKLYSQVLAACFILLFFSAGPGNTAGPDVQPGPGAQNAAEVLIDRSTSYNSTIYSISSGGCTIQWIARNSEIGVIKYWSDCALSLAEQLPLLEKICAVFFSKDQNAQAFRTLFWGRLEPDNPGAPWELSFRLAVAAHQSPGWDAKRGKARNGDINGFVKDLANREMIYPELKELLARFHKDIKFSCAEKVLVVKAEKLPFFDQLKQQGVKKTDRLPFDCMTWFSISALPEK
jgi:hypothetical protein